jgi:hypothetical protein
MCQYMFTIHLIVDIRTSKEFLVYLLDNILAQAYLAKLVCGNALSPSVRILMLLIVLSLVNLANTTRFN